VQEDRVLEPRNLPGLEGQLDAKAAQEGLTLVAVGADITGPGSVPPCDGIVPLFLDKDSVARHDHPRRRGFLRLFASEVMPHFRL